MKKTTLELPDGLVREIKIRAAQQNRTVKDVVAELLRRGLADDAPQLSSTRQRVRLPLIRGGHPASPEEEPTPERVAELLLADELPPL